jgi:hypothetical protein
MKFVLMIMLLFVWNAAICAEKTVRCNPGEFATTLRQIIADPEQPPSSGVRFLKALGYSESVAQRIAKTNPELLAKMKENKKLAKPIVAFRGFSGKFSNFEADRGAADTEIWFATQMTDPASYVNLPAIEKLQANRDELNKTAAKFRANGYIIEYELPGGFTKQQTGALGRPQPGPPKKGKSIMDRGENGTWGFFNRSDIPNESPFIKSVYFQDSATQTTEPVKIRGVGTFNIDVLRAKYYRVPYDEAFVNGKPVSNIPKRTPTITITKYEQDPN